MARARRRRPLAHRCRRAGTGRAAPAAGPAPVGAALRTADGAASSNPLGGQFSGQLQAQGRWPALALSGDLRATACKSARCAPRALQAKVQAGPDAAGRADGAARCRAGRLDAWVVDTLQLRLDGSLAEHRLTWTCKARCARRHGPTRGWAAAPTAASSAGRAQGQWQTAEARSERAAGPLARPGPGGRSARPRHALPPARHGSRARDLRLQLQFDEQGRVQAASAEPGRIEALGAALRWTDAQWHAASAHGADPGHARCPARTAADRTLADAPAPGRRPGRRPDAGRPCAAEHWAPRFAADVVLERSSGDLTLTDDTGTQPFGLTDLRLALGARRTASGTSRRRWPAATSACWPARRACACRRRPPGRAPTRRCKACSSGRSPTSAPGRRSRRPGWRLSGTLRTGAALGGTLRRTGSHRHA